MSLPEAEERPFGGHSAPSFRIQDKLFATTYEDGSALTVKAGPGVQQALVQSHPAAFFVPPYVGSKGWVGVKLAAVEDWDEIDGLIIDSYRLIAPKRLVQLLGD